MTLTLEDLEYVREDNETEIILTRIYEYKVAWGIATAEEIIKINKIKKTVRKEIKIIVREKCYGKQEILSHNFMPKELNFYELKVVYKIIKEL